MGARRYSRLRRRSLGDVQDEKLWESAKASYPPTSDPGCAGFILPDGTWLNMCMGEGNFPTHDVIRWAYPAEERKRLGGKAIGDFLKRGAIRVHRQTGAPETVIEFHKRPTIEQGIALREYLRNFEVAWAEVVDDKRIALHHESWGTGASRFHPDAVVNWIRREGFEGLGAPEHVRAEIDELKKCAVPADSFVSGKGFILPDGSIVPTMPHHNNIRDCVSKELRNSFDYDTMQYHLVEDAVAAGIIRIDYDPGGDFTIQSIESITPSQKTTIGRMVKNANRVYVDVLDDQEAKLVRYNLFEIPWAHEVIKFISVGGESWTPMTGLGQVIAYPAGSPHGRLKFHWDPVTFRNGLDIARSCGDLRQDCQLESHPQMGQVMTCTWRNVEGTVVAAAAGPQEDVARLHRSDRIGKTTSLWTDRDLLKGRCPR